MAQFTLVSLTAHSPICFVVRRPKVAAVAFSKPFNPARLVIGLDGACVVMGTYPVYGFVRCNSR